MYFRVTLFHVTHKAPRSRLEYVSTNLSIGSSIPSKLTDNIRGVIKLQDLLKYLLDKTVTYQR